MRGIKLIKLLAMWAAVLAMGLSLRVKSDEQNSSAAQSGRASAETIQRMKTQLPSVTAEGGYVSSQACQECHLDEHASWHRSYHRTMTQLALPENIRAGFDGTTIDSGGLLYRIFRKGQELWAEMPDPDQMMYIVQGEKKTPLQKVSRVERQVLLVTGSHHYHTFWVGSPRYPRLLQTLPLVYLIEDKRWVPREAAFMRGPDDTGRFITQWNHHCIRCHSTGGNPGLNEQTGMLETRVAEFGIACEACHGPGRDHVEFRRLKEAQDALGKEDPIINPKKLSPKKSAEACGQCHGVYIMRDEYAMEYAKRGPLFKPGDDLHQTRYYIQHPQKNPSAERWEDFRKNTAFFRERWWDDGTILAGGREYTALSAAACYQKGEMSCLSCHSMHESDPVDQLKKFKSDNDQCTQCHKAVQYTEEISKHTFHAANSSGSNCLNCHMPHTTYALLKGIRSHQISSPNVASSHRPLGEGGAPASGAPNACNLCHLDKTLQWTQEHLARNYGQPARPLADDEQKVAASLLWLLKGHAAQRVITAWHYGWAPARQASIPTWAPPFLANLLNDNYGVVRYIAGRSLQSYSLENWSYDFLAAPAERTNAVYRTLSLWRQSLTVDDSPSRLFPPSVLIKPDGSFDRQTVSRLLQQRDQRPITIKE